MSFRFRLNDPFGPEIRRLAASQIDEALAELEDPLRDRQETIHDVRKRMKKLRALLRLVRPVDRDLARTENARFRDAARGLSQVRDRTALVEAVDALRRHNEDAAAARPLEALRAEMERRRQQAIEAAGDGHSALEAVRAALADSRTALADAPILDAATQPAARAARAGLLGNYRLARRALKQARGRGKADDLHELRKRMKDLAVHLRLLRALWPPLLKAAEGEARKAAEDLGADHDLVVLKAEVETDPEAFGGDEEAAALLRLASDRQAELQRSALAVSARLLAERPKTLGRRLEALRRLAGGKNLKRR